MKNSNNQAGFTLIEMLVVIAVIGFLSSVVIASVSIARVKSRDVKRKSDLSQMQKALELYYNSNNAYPCTGTGTAPNNCSSGVAWHAATGSCGGTYGYTGSSGYIPDIAPTFLSVLPADPKPSTTACSGYNYRSDGTNYKIISNSVGGLGGPENISGSSDPFYDPARTNTAWMITNNNTATAAW